MCGIALLVSGVSVDWTSAWEAPADAGSRIGDLSGFDAALQRRGPDAVDTATVALGAGAELCVHASLLQLRGDAPGGAIQRSEDGSLLCFNGASLFVCQEPSRAESGVFPGEVFGGLSVAPEQSDSAVLLTALSADADVVAVISRVRGPWALAFFQASTSTLWFGRDVLGRRR
jgi:asparagine synthetase B (glutamine-hydrolysing)